MALHFSLGQLLNLFFSLSQYTEAMHAIVQCPEMFCATVEVGSHAPGTIPSSLHTDWKEIAGAACDASRTTVLLKRIVYRIFQECSFCHPKNLTYLQLHLEEAS